MDEVVVIVGMLTNFQLCKLTSFQVVFNYNSNFEFPTNSCHHCYMSYDPFIIYYCRNPNLAKCGGEAQHLEKWGFGVLRDSRMFRARQQGAKHLALGCSWRHWKGLET
jgi:hypothetical protein